MAPRRPTERARVERAAAALQRAAGGPLAACVVLGSGIPSPFGEDARRIPLRRLPGLPVPGVEGHRGEVRVRVEGAFRTVAFVGRTHLYEGRTAAEVVRPVRAAAVAGARTVILVNASGGVSPRARPGRILILEDHLDLAGGDPDFGADPVPFGPRFQPMAGAYDAGLRAAALRAAGGRGAAFAGTYAFVRGPRYETPAEVAMLRRLGADAVGMSTVPEAVAARRLDCRVLALSVVANRAGAAGLSHGEVLRRAEGAACGVRDIVAGILERVRKGDS